MSRSHGGILSRNPKLLARTQSLPALKDASVDTSPCALPGGFNDILTRSRRLSTTIREPHGDLGSQLILEKLGCQKPPSPRVPKQSYSYTLMLGDPMHGFKIGDRVNVIGRAGLMHTNDGGTVIAAGRTCGLLVVEFDSMPGHLRDVKADCLHHMTAKEEEELEIRKIQSMYKKQERGARRLDRGSRRKTIE